eukprot:749695-Hanusia_phi.AAC.1
MLCCRRFPSLQYPTPIMYLPSCHHHPFPFHLFVHPYFSRILSLKEGVVKFHNPTKSTTTPILLDSIANRKFWISHQSRFPSNYHSHPASPAPRPGGPGVTVTRRAAAHCQPVSAPGCWARSARITHSHRDGCLGENRARLSVKFSRRTVSGLKFTVSAAAPGAGPALVTGRPGPGSGGSGVRHSVSSSTQCQ